jgi:hypothetical protein
VKVLHTAVVRRFAWLLILLGLGAIYIYVWRPVRLLCWHEFRAGNKIISRIDTYRNTHGRLPESLNEIGISDSDGVYYQKSGSNDFVVWFGTSLGESETYDSHTKKWQ